MKIKLTRKDTGHWELSSLETGTVVADVYEIDRDRWQWHLAPDIFFGNGVERSGYGWTKTGAIGTVTRKIQTNGLYTKTEVK